MLYHSRDSHAVIEHNSLCRHGRQIEVSLKGAIPRKVIELRPVHVPQLGSDRNAAVSVVRSRDLS